ncbi:hypothetical protein FACS189487_04560 [Campylobacterota bacterium]|nr:hypothetical protein FACS189487_04560 [Campylobacterota bacterium]
MKFAYIALISAGLLLTACGGGGGGSSDPTPDPIAAMNEADFGVGVTPIVIPISNLAEFTDAKAKIQANSGNFVLNITKPIEVGDAEAFIAPTTNTIISLRGGGTIYKSSGTNILFYLSDPEDSQKLILRDVTLKGHTTGVNNSLVYVRDGAVFNMYDGGTITGNKSDFGGAVSINGGVFNMYGGTISDNEVIYNGGGVCVSDGAFNMSGGTISGNKAVTYGGGVLVDFGNGGTFTKTGGTIYGSGDATNKNEAGGSGKGHAVFVGVDGGSNDKYRDTTLGNTSGGNISTDNLTSGWNE